MKSFCFELAAFVEAQCGGGFDGVDGRERREQAALLFCDSFARGGEDRSVLVGVPSFSLRSRVLGAGLRGDFAGECDCAGEKIAFDESINDSELLELPRL